MFPPALMQLTVIYCPHHAQAVIIPIIKKESDREPVTEAVARLEAIAKQAGIRVKVSWRGGKGIISERGGRAGRGGRGTEAIASSYNGVQ